MHDVAQDPLFATFLLAYMDREATPTLSPVPGIDLDAYKHQLIERFSNASVRDTVPRLCAESSDRIPKWLIPVVRENLAAGRRCPAVRRDRGQLGPLRRRRRRTGRTDRPSSTGSRTPSPPPPAGSTTEPLAFISNQELFGDLAADERFTAPYLDALNSLHDKGSRATLQMLVG